MESGNQTIESTDHRVTITLTRPDRTKAWAVAAKVTVLRGNIRALAGGKFKSPHPKLLIALANEMISEAETAFEEGNDDA